jgi:RNA polymerase sigma-70 factor (ECF subfamily)
MEIRGAGTNSYSMRPDGRARRADDRAPRGDDLAAGDIPVADHSVANADVADAAGAPERRTQFENEALGHLDALYSFALKLARSRDDAEDLVSDTLLRAFERWEQYRLGTNIRRIDAREVQPTDEGEGWSAFEAVGEVDPEGRFYDSFLDEEITRAIDALPDEYRSAVVLSDVHELRYAEIAQVLGVPEGTVKSRLFRGRRILQKKLVNYAVEMGYIKVPTPTPG